MRHELPDSAGPPAASRRITWSKVCGAPAASARARRRRCPTTCSSRVQTRVQSISRSRPGPPSTVSRPRGAVSEIAAERLPAEPTASYDLVEAARQDGLAIDGPMGAARPTTAPAASISVGSALSQHSRRPEPLGEPGLGSVPHHDRHVRRPDPTCAERPPADRPTAPPPMTRTGSPGCGTPLQHRVHGHAHRLDQDALLVESAPRGPGAAGCGAPATRPTSRPAGRRRSPSIGPGASGPRRPGGRQVPGRPAVHGAAPGRPRTTQPINGSTATRWPAQRPGLDARQDLVAHHRGKRGERREDRARAPGQQGEVAAADARQDRADAESTRRGRAAAAGSLR